MEEMEPDDYLKYITKIRCQNSSICVYFFNLIPDKICLDIILQQNVRVRNVGPGVKAAQIMQF